MQPFQMAPSTLISPAARAFWQNNLVARERYTEKFDESRPSLMENEQTTGDAMSPDEFIAEVGPPAQESAKDTTIPASFTVADAALESGWGASQLAQQAHNLFGIKADASWNGPTISMPTREYINDQWITETALWRSYPDWLSSIKDRADFLKSQPRYESAFPCSNGPDFATTIANCGYATDPNYASEILSIINTHGLTSLD